MIVFGVACFAPCQKLGGFGRCFLRRVAELSPMRQMFSETDFGFKAGGRHRSAMVFQSFSPKRIS